MVNLNYETDTQIQPDALDVEWLKQPRLMLHYAQHQAEMRRALDEAKEAYEQTRAKLDVLIRSNPEEYGVKGRVTNEAINNVLLNDKDVKEAKERIKDATYEYEMSRAAVNAMEHKRAALENLVKLFGQQYFAGPSVPRDLNGEWKKEMAQKESNQKVKIRKRRVKNVGD